jgi:hypothetical protein
MCSRVLNFRNDTRLDAIEQACEHGLRRLPDNAKDRQRDE